MSHGKITSPVSYFGHQPGEARKLIRWEKIVEYFQHIAKETDRMILQNVGPSTEGHPFLVAYISSPANLAKLEEYRQINAKITDPRGLDQAALDDLVKKGKAVVVQTMSLHASEVGGTQMSPELAYDLLTTESEEGLRILDEVISIMVPCFNPDGQIMVTDWYNKYLGTEYEGCGMPWLYHKYCGHDNNRDAFAWNLIESRYVGEIMFQQWHPHAFQDHHHMGSNGARLYIAPYSDPIHPNPDPLVWAELRMYGSHMAYRLEEEGKKGILTGGQFPGWGHMGFHWFTNHHNIAGMLTESASAKTATPLYIPPEQLTGANERVFPAYQQQVNFVHPWEGGWWTLRDIVEQQKVSAWALLDCAARNKDIVLRNAIKKAQRQTALGASEKPYGYVINMDLQNDYVTTYKLIKVLEQQGFELHMAEDHLHFGDQVAPAGSIVIYTAQPKRAAIRTLLGRTFFNDNWFSRRLDNTSNIYDTTTDTYAEFMGVTVLEAQEPIHGQTKKLDKVPPLIGRFAGESDEGYQFASNLNQSYRLANRVLAAGYPVWRTRLYGDFVTEANAKEVLEASAKELGVDVEEFDGLLAEADIVSYKPSRIGMYRRYLGGSMDEGWSRLTLEQFEFPYITIMDKDVWEGNLIEKFDVIFIPADRKAMLTDVTKDASFGMMRRYIGAIPEGYMSGLKKEGIDALKAFVKAGGRLVAQAGSCDWVVGAFELGLKNVVDGKSVDEFFTHGATLHTQHMDHPINWGMPQEGLTLNFDSPAYVITDNGHAEDYTVLAKYPERDVLESGMLYGEKLITGKAAAMHVQFGKGDIVLLGYNAQYRAQTDGTYKPFFNSLMKVK